MLNTLTKYLIVVLTITASSTALGQNNPMDNFHVIGDSSLKYDRVFFGASDSSKIRFVVNIHAFYDSCGVISLDEAIKKSRVRGLNNATLNLNTPEGAKHWIFVCRYRITAPKRFGGFGGFYKYREVIVNAENGKLIESKRVKKEWTH